MAEWLTFHRYEHALFLNFSNFLNPIFFAIYILRCLQLLMISPDVMENIASIRAFVMKLSATNAQV